jgi:hypothetical protein
MGEEERRKRRRKRGWKKSTLHSSVDSESPRSRHALSTVLLATSSHLSDEAASLHVSHSDGSVSSRKPHQVVRCALLCQVHTGQSILHRAFIQQKANTLSGFFAGKVEMDREARNTGRSKTKPYQVTRWASRTFGPAL